MTPTRLLPLGLRMKNSPHFVDWAFENYLEICPPSYALERSPSLPPAEHELAAAV